MEGGLRQPRLRTDPQPLAPRPHPRRLQRRRRGGGGRRPGALAQGTDGAGSIRIPAAFCGAFGFKPSWGRVPQHPASVVETLSHAGPITRTVGDAVLMLQTMAGPDARDRTSMPAEPVALDQIEGGVDGLRAAWSSDLGYAAVDPRVVETARAAALRFQDLGCTLEEAHPETGDPWRLLHTLWSTAFAATFRDDFDNIADRLDPGLRAVIEEGFRFRGTDVAAAYLERNPCTTTSGGSSSRAATCC